MHFDHITNMHFMLHAIEGQPMCPVFAFCNQSYLHGDALGYWPTKEDILAAVNDVINYGIHIYILCQNTRKTQ